MQHHIDNGQNDGQGAKMPESRSPGRPLTGAMLAAAALAAAAVLIYTASTMRTAGDATTELAESSPSSRHASECSADLSLTYPGGVEAGGTALLDASEEELRSTVTASLEAARDQAEDQVHELAGEPADTDEAVPDAVDAEARVQALAVAIDQLEAGEAQPEPSSRQVSLQVEDGDYFAAFTLVPAVPGEADSTGDWNVSRLQYPLPADACDDVP